MIEVRPLFLITEGTLKVGIKVIELNSCEVALDVVVVSQTEKIAVVFTQTAALPCQPIEQLCVGFRHAGPATDLSFSDHSNQLNARQCSLGTVEVLEPQHRFGDLLYHQMILLNDIVHKPTLSEFFRVDS